MDHFWLQVLSCSDIFPIDHDASVMNYPNVCIPFRFRQIMWKILGSIFGNSGENKIKKAENNNGNQESISKNNWIGPDGVESGPDVPEDWYLTYDGPAPIVEDIYDENYVVDRGNGTVPVDFYIKNWGVPEGFGKTDHEKQWSME